MSDDPIKDVLHRMPDGFYSITSRSGDDVNAMVANWVTQASFTPRLVAVGLQKKAYTHDVVKEGGVFAINIFRSEDKDAIMGLTKGRAKNPDKMAEAEYTTAPETGCPVMAGAAAYVECNVVDLIDVGGDHDILVGEVVGADVMKKGEAKESLKLTDLGWSYAG